MTSMYSIFRIRVVLVLSVMSLIVIFPVWAFSQVFMDSGAVLPGMYDGDAEWGDFDNDGFLDVLITGKNIFEHPITKLYRNTGDGFREVVNAGLPAVKSGDVSWGDFDNDGFPDVFITGEGEDGTRISAVYRNNDGQGEFSIIEAGFPGVINGGSDWGDFDNDGDLDILYIGKADQPITKLYRNNGDGGFTEVETVDFEPVFNGSVSWGDYDNDGDLDVLLSGWDKSLQTHTVVYRNKNGVFTDIDAGLMGCGNGVAVWGDFDADGDLDILLTGYNHYTYEIFTLIYENNGGVFTDMRITRLAGVQRSDAAWIDYDNDGKLDIFLAGENGAGHKSNMLYRNNDNGLFADVLSGVFDVRYGSVSFGDYDNDGKDDLLIIGQNVVNKPVAKIYHNGGLSVDNRPPEAPANLAASVKNRTVELSWDAPVDDHTPYDAITYNLRVGATPNGVEIVSPASGMKKASSKTGQIRTTSYRLTNLPDGDYYWSVQAVDASGAVSAFSEEAVFSTSDFSKIKIEAKSGAAEDNADEAIFEVIRQGDLSNPLEVEYTLSGTASENDYSGNTSGILRFEAGSHTAEIRLNITDDADFDPDETITATISDSQRYIVDTERSATLRITDDDLPTVSVAAGTKPSEFDSRSGAFIVTRTGDLSAALSVGYTIGGTADDLDYTDSTGSPVVIPAGETTAEIVIAVIDDTITDPAETVSVRITIPVGYTVGDADAAELTIIDNESPTISIMTAIQPDEEGPVKGMFVIKRTGDLTRSVTVNYTLSGTAAAGTDYSNGSSGSVAIGAEESTGFFMIDTIDDDDVDPNETIVAAIDKPSGYYYGDAEAATTTIIDNDLPEVNIAATRQADEEGPVDGVFTLTRSGGNNAELQVAFTLSGNAEASTDYYRPSSPAVFQVGSDTAIVLIDVIDDTIVEANERVTATIDSGEAYLIGQNDSADITITDNDTPGILISAQNVDISESGTTAEYNIRLLTIPTNPVSVTVDPDDQIDIGNGPGASATLIFDADYTAKTPKIVTVSAVDDADFENAHTGAIVHSATSDDSNYDGANAHFDPSRTVTADILDNDASGVVINEFLIDHAGDDAHEFIEIKGQSSTDYSGFWVLQIEGDADDNPGGVDSAHQAGTTNASGYWWTGYLTDRLENGSMTLLLVSNYTSASDIDTDDDGIIDTAAWDMIMDSVAVSDGGSGDVFYSDIVLDNVFGASRIPDGIYTMSADDFMKNDFDGAGISELNPGTPRPSEALNTPWAENRQIAIGVTLTESGGVTEVSEDGDQDNYMLKLDTYPTGDVSITATPNNGQIDLGNGPGNPVTLTFTADNWFGNQSVDIAAVDDTAQEGNHTAVIVHTVNGGGYTGYPLSNVTVSITDNEMADITVTPTTLTISEPDGSAAFNLKLTMAPTADVVIGLSVTNGECQLSKNSVTLNDTNWDTGESVTVTAVDDLIADGDVISVVETAAAVSSDPQYVNINADNINVTVKDDETAMVIVNPTDITLSEPDVTATFNIKLSTEPRSQVTVGLSVSNTECTVPDAVVLDASNWSTGVDVTISPVDDDIMDGDMTATILTAVTVSDDEIYDGLDVDDVNATIRDDDVPSVVVSPTALTVREPDGSAIFNIRLTTQPTADVEIGLSVSNTECSVTDTVTLPAANWDTGVNVVVTAIDDTNQDGDMTSVVITGATVSSDPNYNGLDPEDITVTVKDDDSPEVMLSTDAIEIAEGGNDADYQIRLNTIPADTVTVMVDPDDQIDVGGGTGVAISLTFNPDATALNSQYVTATAVDDGIYETDHSGVIVHSTVSNDPDYSNPGFTPGNTVTATITDNDIPPVIINEYVFDHATSNNWEYVEIKGDPNTDYSNYTLLQIEGDAQDNPGAIVSAHQMGVSNTSGYWWTGYLADTFENGSMTLLLVDGYTSGTDLDTDDDGQFDSTPWTAIVDSIAVTDQDAGDVLYSPIDLGMMVGASRIPDGTYTPSADDFIPNDYDGAGIPALYPGTPAVGEAMNTPAAENTVVELTVMVLLTGERTEVSESGITDTYNLRLMAKPSDDVTVTITPGSSQIDLGKGPGTAKTVTFTAAGWFATETITVTAVDDDDYEGDHTAVIHHLAAGGGYDGVGVDDVTVDIIDNDSVEIIVAPTELTMAEPDGAASFNIRLVTQPISDVVVNITASNTECSVNSSVTLNQTNWLDGVDVDVTVNDDAVADGEMTTTIQTHAAVTTDPDYSGFDPPDVTVTVQDDDTPGIIVEPAALSLDEPDGSGTFTIRTTSPPLADVSVSLTASNAECSVTDNVVINSTNWETGVEVGVDVVDDFYVDGDMTCVIQTAAATSSDFAYAGIDPGDVTVTVSDNDIANVDISTTELEMAEGEEGTAYELKLTSIPSDAVIVTIDPDSQIDVGNGADNPITLTFAADVSALTPQTVTATVVDDDVSEGDHTGIIVHRTGSADPDYANITITPTDEVVVSIIDNDTAELLINEFVFDHVSWDTNEYVEVKGVPNTDYSDYSLVQIEGDIGENPGVVLNVYTVGVTDNDGYWSTGYVSDQFENGTLTLILVNNFTMADDLDIYNTGELDTSHWLFMADAVAVDDGDAGDFVYTDIVLDKVGGASRIPDGANSQSADDWMLNDFDGAGIPELDPGSPMPGEAWNTPNAKNASVVYEILIIESDAATTVTEDGASDTYFIQLGAMPTGSVTVHIEPESDELDIGEGPGGAVDIEFTPDDWNDYQTIQVAAVDDSALTGNRSITIHHSASGGNYDGITADLTVNIVDNESAGITIVPVTEYVTTESGGKAVFTVQLNSMPRFDVMLSITSNNTDEGTVAPASATFTSDNWDTPQTVTVTGVADDVDDGNVDYSVILDPASEDPGYNALDAIILEFTNMGNQPPTNIRLSNNTVAENASAGSVVGTLSAVDPDDADTHLFTLAEGDGDAGNAYFTIDGNVLKSATVFSYADQSSYSIRVKVEDSSGGAFEKIFTIFIIENTVPVVESYFLKVEIDGKGWVTGTGIDCGYDCSEYFKASASARLNAIPDDGYRFGYWEGDLTGENNPVNVTMDRDKYVTAVFVKIPASATANLGILKTVDIENPSVGETVVFTVMVVNNGPGEAARIRVEDVLPEGLAYVSDNAGGTYNPAAGIWNVGDLPATPTENVKTLEILATVQRQGEIVNIATITGFDGTDPDISDNSSSVVINPLETADIAVTFTADNKLPYLGDTVNYTITVKNWGPYDANNVRVQNRLPDKLDHLSDNSDGTYTLSTGIWDIGTLVLGASKSLNIETQVVELGDIRNTATRISSSPMDPNPDNDSATVTINSSIDRDNDGMPDTWEMENGLDTTLDDSANDPDGDGIPNYHEYLFGTDPWDPADKVIDHQTVVEGETVILGAGIVNNPNYTYAWTQMSGPSATLSDTTSPQPFFVTPPVTPPGEELLFRLIITDNRGYQTYHNVKVTVNDNGVSGFADDVLAFLTTGGQYIGIKVQSGGALIRLNAIHPDMKSDVGEKPEDIYYGLISTTIKTNGQGSRAVLTFYLLSPAPEGYRWFIYSELYGWMDISDNAAYDPSRKIVTIDLRDGGFLDDDFLPNGRIVIVSGIGFIQEDDAPPTDDDGNHGTPGSGGGGCFIRGVLHDVLRIQP